MTSLEIKTADEFVALDREARWTARRAARESDIFRRILQIFVDRGGPIPVEAVVAAFPGAAAGTTHLALVALDADDLIRVRDGGVDVAYPFTASPTPWVVRLAGGAERYACCAMDALGIAPMVGQRIEIRSRCHHCGTPLELSATPEGPGPETAGVMLWIGERGDDRCKAADSL